MSAPTTEEKLLALLVEDRAKLRHYLPLIVAANIPTFQSLPAEEQDRLRRLARAELERQHLAPPAH